MKFSEVWKEIKDDPKDRILVTGPQRSGTKVVANALCMETGFSLIRHTKMPPKEGIYEFCQQKNVVLHSPSWVVNVPDLIAEQNTHIVFVRRPIEEIRDSIKRCKWDCEEEEMALIDHRVKDCEFEDSAEAKLWLAEIWEKFIFVLDYESMKEHPTWTDARSIFTINQVDSRGSDYYGKGVKVWRDKI
jgi:hypothetical protein